MDEVKTDGASVPAAVVTDTPAAAAAPVVEQRDYKAELEAKQKELEQAQYTIIKLKTDKKEKNEGKENNEEDVSTKENGKDIKEDSEEEITKIVEERIESFKLEHTADVLDEELDNLTADPDKKELIKLTYNKRINKTGFNRLAIKADLMTALAIVDQPRLESTIKEMRQAAISRSTTTTSAPVAGQQIGDSSGMITESMLTPMDKKIMARHGLTLKDLNKK